MDSNRLGKVIVPNDAGAGTLKRHLLEIIDVLHELRLSYMVIGAFALPVWGRPRATLDLDFMIQTSDVPEEFAAKLKALGFEFDEQWSRRIARFNFPKVFRHGR